MIEKIKYWKIRVKKTNDIVNDKIVYFRLNKECSLIASCHGAVPMEFLGWNIYSALRALFDFNKVVRIYRMKDGEWIKLDKQKVKTIAYKPMECE
jgi:hypothetical protein